MKRRDGSSAQDVDVRAFYTQLGDVVRKARQKARMTQDDLAHALGLTRASIANLEAGRQRVPVHTLVAASHALGVPVELLVPRDAPQGSTRPTGVPRSTPQEHVDLVQKLVGNVNRNTEG